MSVSGSNQGVRFGVATSTNRPSTPFDGQVIYETDTDRIMAYDGTNWIPQVSAGTIDAKGDLLAGTADNTVARLAVGINGYRVTAASGESTGLKYDMPSVPVFADTTARDNAFGGAGEKTLADGQMCYISAAPKRLQVYNGTAWIDYDAAYTSFTPTWTNLTIGNGTQNFRYARLGKFVHVVGLITFGSTTSMGTAPYFSNPVGSNLAANTVTGWTYLLDSGAGNSLGITVEGGGVQVFNALNTAGTYIANVNITATVPWTWAVNDQLYCNLMYEAS